MREIAYKGISFRLQVEENMWSTGMTLISADAKRVGEPDDQYSQLGLFTIKEKDENKDS